MGMLYSQLFITPKKPSTRFTGQTVIITGSNTGLGKEAARQIANLDAARVILAVRNVSAGEAARQSIISVTSCHPDAISVWHLDLSSYASVKAFARRASIELCRIDVLCNNAGVALLDWTVAEGHEQTITINVISTFLLTLLLLPKMRDTGSRFNVKSRINIVSSEVHSLTKFTQRTEPDIFAAISDTSKSKIDDRYPLSKLLQVLAVRYGLGPALNSSSAAPAVIVNYLNPGLCNTDLSRHASGLMAIQFAVLKTLFARSAEVGGRTLVAAAAAGKDSHGRYMSNGVVAEQELSKFVRSGEGQEVGKRVWRELCDILEGIEPGVTKNLYDLYESED